MSAADSIVTLLYLVTVLVMFMASVRWSELRIDEDSIVRGIVAATPFLVGAASAEDNLIVVSEWVDRFARFNLHF